MVIKVAQQQQQQQQQMHSSSPPDLAKLNELFPSSEAYYQSMSRPKTIAKPDKIALKSMTRDEMKDWLVSIDEKPSRVEQLIESMYRRRQLSPTKAAAGEEEKDDDGNSSVSNYCNDVEDMSSEISAKFRAKMHELASFGGDLTLDSINVAKDGTRKVTYALSDGGIVESVIIPPFPGEAEEDGKKGRTTVCVSSQLGCAMNCQFCFTAKMGLRKNLNANQIVQQVVNARDIAGEDVTNVVFMGMGEPLHNTENVLKAVKIMTDPKGLNFSKNRVTVSTSGLIPGIERFLDESDCMLAVSLNATTNEIRNWIMPINRKYPLEDLLGVIRERFSNNSSGGGGGSSSSSSSDERAKRSRRQQRVFFEYIMLANVNDSFEDADRIIEISKTIPCKINLIYFNTHDGSEFTCSNQEHILAFRNYLLENGVLATIRKSRGDEEMAACGQLGKPEDQANWKPQPPRMKPPKSMSI
jgi:23S rRNA (adenine2503-C2)-methyltransferase